MSGDPQYSFSESDLGAITNLEAAQVALRWLGEKWRSLEEENRGMRAKFEAVTSIHEEKNRQLDVLTRALEERGKRLGEQEEFFKKLGNTYKIFSEGRLDVSLIVQKQLELDGLQKRLIEEHQHRLVDLERSQQQIQARWHERLLELESQYAERLNGARRQFESLRRAQETATQDQAKQIEESFKKKEERLAEEKHLLEQDYSQKKLELEAAIARQKSALEQEFEALKTQIYRQVEAERQAAARQNEERIKILNATLIQEKSRAQEEGRRAEFQITELTAVRRKAEQDLAQLQAAYHQEVLGKIASYEESYRKKLEELQAKEQQMDQRYLVRTQELEAAYQERSRTVQEQSAQNQRTRLEAESDLRANFEREKLLLEQELRAALESSQGLTRRIHELEEQHLAQNMRREAEWSRLAEEFRQEKEQTGKLRQDYQALERQAQSRLETAARELAAGQSAYRTLEETHRKMEAEIAGWKSAQEQEMVRRMTAFQNEHQGRIRELDEETARRQSEFAARERALTAERDRLYKDLEKRRMELDDLERVLLKRLEDLEAAKQATEKEWREREEGLRRRDQEWSQHRHRLEKVYQEKATQLEQMKQELLKEIENYRNAKV